MIFYEQADRGKEGTIYSWLLDGAKGHKKELQILGFKFVRGVGSPGCFVTNNANLVRDLANQWHIPVKSNGTHATIGADQLITV